jgi:hypothetical protein
VTTKVELAGRVAELERERDQLSHRLAGTGERLTVSEAACRRLEGELAELERERDQLAEEVVRHSVGRDLLSQRLAGLGERLAQSEAARRRLEGELGELTERHAELEATHRAATAHPTRAARLAAEPRVRVRWLKDTPDGGATIGDVVYTARGPGYQRASGPGGREYEALAWLGEETEMPVGHAQMLSTAGYIEPATGRDAAWLDYDQLLHSALVHPSGRDDAATRWAVDQQGRMAPVPDGWPGPTYAELHPDPVELPPGLESRRAPAEEPATA